MKPINTNPVMSTEDSFTASMGTTTPGLWGAVVLPISQDGTFTQASASSHCLERAASHWHGDRAGMAAQLQHLPQLTRVPPRAP